MDNSRIKLMEKSRQIGISWCTAYDLVRRHSAGTALRDSWVCSRDELQAKLFIDDCRKFAEIVNTASLGLAGRAAVEDFDTRTLSFANGTRIWSLSSNPDAQAGKRGARILDEFALHPDPERLYAVSYPGITWGGSLCIISTHRGRENFFNRLVREIREGGNPKKISLHRVTLQDALEQGFLRKLKARLGCDCEISGLDEAAYFDRVRASCADDESFMQEYMCSPSDENSRFIRGEHIELCAYRPDEDWRAISDGANFLYLGVDVARSSDLSVFWLLERAGDVLYTRDVKALRNVSFAEQEAVLHSYLKNPMLLRACIDQSGLGRQFAERAAARYGFGRAEGVTFTARTKEELAYPLRALFEGAKLRIPNDIDTLADIRSVKRLATAGGAVRLGAERTKDGHADRFWALALATRAAREAHTQGGLSLVEKPHADFVW